MKVSGHRFHVRNQYELTNFVQWVNEQWEAGVFPTVQVMKNERSNSQNRFIHGIYGDIARRLDQTIIEVKRDAKLRFGVPILREADEDFCALYDKSIKGNLTFEQKLVLMDYLPVTSEFNTEQASMFIDTLLAEYGRQGIAIADPRK